MRPTLEVYVNGDDALLRWGVDELDDRVPRLRRPAPPQRRRAGVARQLRAARPGRSPARRVRALRRRALPLLHLDRPHGRRGRHGQLPRHAGDVRCARAARGPRERLEPAAHAAGGRRRLGLRRVLQPRFRDVAVRQPLPRRALPRRHRARRRCAASRPSSRPTSRTACGATSPASFARRSWSCSSGPRAGRATSTRRCSSSATPSSSTGSRRSARAPTSCSPTGRCRSARARRPRRRATRDENADARAQLVAAGVDVETTNRFTAPGALAHDKFLVIASAAGRAAHRLDRQHELDDDRPLHAAQQRPARLRPGGRRRLPRAVARAARRAAAAIRRR